jgi:hypothetical protein
MRTRNTVEVGLSFFVTRKQSTYAKLAETLSLEREEQTT